MIALFFPSGTESCFKLIGSFNGSLLQFFFQYYEQRWSRGHKAPGQGQGHKKKIQGQGQSFRGQTLSRPRTGMLEAKDQGHSLTCFPKKKGLQKVFQAISNL